MNRSLLFVLLLASQILNPAWGKKFSNRYLEYELPIGWDCMLRGNEYVCQSSSADKKQEAIIILAAKKRGPQDTILAYKSYLKEVKTYSLPGGRTQVSEPKYASNKSIHDHVWVDSLQLASEVPGFYTRYLATVKEDLGVAVTFSVRKDLYEDYKQIIDNVVLTLKVFRQRPKGINNLALKKQEENLLDNDHVFIPSEVDKYDISQRKRDKSTSFFEKGDNALFLILLLGVGLGFVIIRKRGKKK